MQSPLCKKPVMIGLASLFFIGFIASGSKAEEVGSIIDIKGSVEIQHPADPSWLTAQEKMGLGDKDRIKTSADSEALIALDSTLKNIVKLEPDTEITLEDVKLKRMHMPRGEILALIEALPAGSSFEVRTPTAVAGVAGSGMSVDTDGRRTKVKCFEDQVYVRGIKVDGTPMTEVVYIEGGYKRIIEEFQVPSGLITLTPDEINRWVRFVANIKKRVEESLEKSVKRYEEHPDLKELFK